MKTEITDLSPQERRVLYVICEHAPVTVIDIQRNLQQQKSYNAIRRILDVLVQKQFVEFEKKGRQYVYSPMFSKAEQGTKLLNEVVRAFFDRSPALGFVSLIKDTKKNETLQDLEIEAVRRLLEKNRENDSQPEPE